MRVTAAADGKGHLANGTGSAEWLNRHDSDVFSGRVFEQYSYVGHGFLHAVIKNWRASPHCRLVNLVRSGRKQPQPITASAGGKARLLLWCRQSVIECLSRLLFLPLAGGSWIGGEAIGESVMKKIGLLISVLLFSGNVPAVDGVSVEYGNGDAADMARAGAVWNWDKQWFTGGDWLGHGFLGTS